MNCFDKNHAFNHECIHVYIPSKNGESDLFNNKIESNLVTTRTATPSVAVRGFQPHSLQIFKRNKNLLTMHSFAYFSLLWI